MTMLAPSTESRGAESAPGAADSVPEAPGLQLVGQVLHVCGPLDPAGVLQVRGEGERLIDANGAELVVDLGRVPGAHSATLSLLLCWQRHAESHGHSLQFRNVGEQLHSLAALSGLHRYLPGFAADDHR